MKKQTQFKKFKRIQPFFTVVKAVLRLFFRKPEIMAVGDEIKEPCIFVANHESKGGPVIYELYLPYFHAKWGAHEMLENYSERRKYLRDVYYIQKKGCNKFRANVSASFEAFFSILFYRGMRFIPTYTDVRFLDTLSDSVDTLTDGTSVLIFPENSEEGYKEELSSFLPGFVALAEYYYGKTKRDIPVCPVYYHKKTNRMIIGQPEYVQPLKERGMKRAQIAEYFCGKVNSLFHDYINEK